MRGQERGYRCPGWWGGRCPGEGWVPEREVQTVWGYL